MDVYGIESMDPAGSEEILEFFFELKRVSELVRKRDRTQDRSEDNIFLFEGILKEWVIEYAIDGIPSKGAVSDLTGKVSLHSNPFALPSFERCSIVEEIIEEVIEGHQGRY